MSMKSRAKRITRLQKENTMSEDAKTAETTVTVYESKKVKAVSAEGVKTEVQTVDATFGNVKGSINYPRNTALTPTGALEMVKGLDQSKTVESVVDGKTVETEVKLDDTEKFLKYFNQGYDAAMRITARNELAVLIEGPEKQIEAVAKRIAKIKFGDDSEESIKKVKALPEFSTLVAVMS